MKNLKFISKSFYIVLLAILLAYFSLDYIRSLARENLPDDLKIFLKTKFFGEKYIKEINFLKISNYNQKVLPETEFLKLSFEKKKISNLKQSSASHYNILNKIKENSKKRFFLTVHEDKIVIVDAIGTTIKLNYKKNFQETILKNNIQDLNPKDIKDAHVINNELFITYSFSYSENCDYFRIAKANLNHNNLIFKIFFDSKECNKNIIAGKMASYIFENKLGLLVTTGTDDNEPKPLAQLDESFYGKIFIFNLDNYQRILISKGHRNPQGLLVLRDKILSTEHGPKGGDEINLIKIGSNYGWPIVSHGEAYDYKLGSNYKFKKNHTDNKFEEPIFSFVPSIGISQILKIPNSFINLWQENFLLSSLNARSLYRIKFDEDFKKVIYKEKIIIGERIRDLIYFEKNSAIILALEDSGSIGIIKVHQ